MQQFSMFFESVAPSVMRIFLSAGVAAIALILVVAFFAKMSKKEFWQTLFLVACIAILGSVVGNAAGLSRVGAVGDVIPAALGLAGGASIALFGGNPNKGMIASVTATAFFLALSLSLTTASKARSIGERQTQYIDMCKQALGDADIIGNVVAYDRFIKVFGVQCAEALAMNFTRIKQADPKSKEFIKAYVDYAEQIAEALK